MPYEIDATHDPDLTSWIESAGAGATDFPIQNLPLAIARRSRGAEREAFTRVGDTLVSIMELVRHGLITGVDIDALRTQGPEALMSPATWRSVRRALSDLLRADNATLRDQKSLRESVLAEPEAVMFETPRVGDYTDFYASVHHATNVGSMFRPGNALLPNYKWIPIGYHGRASSLVPSGTPVRRPRGQLLPGATIEDGEPAYGPCKLLDYEFEMGFFVGKGNALGSAVPIGEAEEHIFGMCIVNDWSARDIQKWEYQPLGPFLAKSFATTLSPYIVTMDALAPFRCPAERRPQDDPAPLPYLTDRRDQESGGVDIVLQASLRSARMREKNAEPVVLSTGNFRHMYWTIAQMLAHHASNGCNLRVGDLMASGTCSGPARDSRGCLLELTWDGDAENPVPTSQRTPIKLPTGEERRFLADGDEVIMRAWCERDGHRRIGFGECRAVIEPAQG